MCKVQSLIYFMCICITVLVTTSTAFTEHHGEVKKHTPKFTLNETEELAFDIRIAKIRLRLKIKEKLDKMSEEEKAEQSKTITHELLTHPLYRMSKRIAVYINMSNEVQTYDIIKNIFTFKKECFIPKVDKKLNRLSMVKLHSMEDLMSLPTNNFNLTQPADDDVREDAFDTGGLDLIITPGVGFTSYGKRLGRGKGYYDRYFTEFDKKFPRSAWMSIGLSFTQQLVDQIPTTKEDHFVHFVLYPEY